MKNTLTVLAASLLALSLTATSVHAGGYQLNLLGQRQIAMGHTGVGMPLDVATISLNPGGLATLDHNALMIGANAPSSAPLTVLRHHHPILHKQTAQSVLRSVYTPAMTCLLIICGPVSESTRLTAMHCAGKMGGNTGFLCVKFL